MLSRAFLALLACLSLLRAEDAEPGSVLVRYLPDMPAELIADVEVRHGLQLASEVPRFRIKVYRYVNAAIAPSEMAARLRAEVIVGHAEPNFIRRPKSVPDPDYSKQWYLSNEGQEVQGVAGPAGIDIRWPAAMGIYQNRGPVIVGVVDSGVALTHVDLKTQLHQKPGEVFGDGIDNDGNGLVDDTVGFDWYDLSPEDRALPLDQNDHGTMVAGVIAAATGNGEGIAGVAPAAKIRAYRVFSQFGSTGDPKFSLGGYSVSDILLAVATAVDDGCAVVNLSLGGPDASQLEVEAFRDLADDDNVLLVVAAGNETTDNDRTPSYPASYDSDAIISVAAVDRTGGLADFSNWGLTSVDLAAPGTQIWAPAVNRVPFADFDFSQGMSGWTTARNVYTDRSYSGWTTWGGFLRDRPQGQPTYAPFTDTVAVSPLLDASLVSGLKFEITGAYDLEDDLAKIEFQAEGEEWKTWETLTGDDYGTESIDLSELDLKKFRIRFRLTSNHAYQGHGVAIKGISITAVDDLDLDSRRYDFTQGTSFAAPIVAGVAALVWSHRPELTAAQVKDAILGSVREMTQLDGAVVTGGMVDAEAALRRADLLAGQVLAEIEWHPRGGFFLERGEIELTVSHQSDLPATYQWRRDGEEIPGATSSTLLIAKAGLDDEGEYDVVITTQAGQVISRATPVLIVAAPPLVTSDPEPVTARPGETVELAFEAEGVGPLAFQWLRNGKPVVGANAATLVVGPLTLANAGDYSVRITGAGGSVTSAAAKVAVLGFTRDLPALTGVAPGGTRTLSVKAVGAPAPAFRWYRDGVLLPGKTAASLAVRGLAGEAPAIYRVEITNATGTVSSEECQVVVVDPVVITSQPQAAFGLEGGSVTLSVGNGGTGDLAYQWLRNGKVIDGATAATLTLEGVSAADAASYSVRITGLANTVTSAAAKVAVLGFTRDLPALTGVAPGGTRTLSVKAVGSPAPTFRWYRDGVLLPGKTAASLAVRGLAGEAPAIYRVEITNATGTVSSEECEVVVVAPVAITSQPQKITGLAGQPTSLSVQVSGGDPVAYQWLKDGKPIAGADQPEYSIPVLGVRDVGNYTVKVSGLVNTVTSAAAKVGIGQMVVFKTDLPEAPIALALGSSRKLAVALSGTGPFSYQWRRDGEEIPGATGATFMVPSSAVEDSETYDVVVESPLGAAVSRSVLVRHFAPLVVTRQPAGLVAGAGGRVVLDAGVSGGGNVTYQWRRNGVDIAGANRARLVLPSASASDEGSYTLVITSPLGTRVTTPAVVDVVAPPVIVTQPSPVSVNAGVSFSLSPVVSAEGAASYQWFKDGEPIAGATSRNYAVVSANSSHEGLYQLYVLNAGGQAATDEIQVTLLGKPVIFSHPAASLSLAGPYWQSSTAAIFDFNNGVQGWQAGSTVSNLSPYSWAWYDGYLQDRAATAGTYASYTDTFVVSPWISLSGTYNSILSFAIVHDLYPDGLDYIRAEWSTDFLNWSPLKTFYGYSQPDVVSINMTSWDNVGFYLRFRLSTSSLYNSGGVALDNIHVYGDRPVVGQRLTLLVQAQAVGATYQWYKDGVAISGANKSIFEVPAVTASDAGVYKVRVSNAAGAVWSNESQVTVY